MAANLRRSIGDMRTVMSSVRRSRVAFCCLASDRAPLVTQVWLGFEKFGERIYQVRLTYTGRDYLLLVVCGAEFDAEDPLVSVNRRGLLGWEKCPFGTQRIYDLKQAAKEAVDGAPGTPLWTARGYRKKAG